MDSLDHIKNTMKLLEDELDEYGRLGIVSAEKETEYKTWRAKLFLESKLDKTLKTVAEREAWVDSRTETERLEYLSAHSQLEAQKQRTQTLRAILNGLQTLASNSRI